MRSDVLLKVGELGELALADFASVRLDAQVNPGVLGEVGAVGKGLVAGCTLIRLGFSHVDLSMELQVCFAGKHLKYNKQIKRVLLRQIECMF